MTDGDGAAEDVANDEFTTDAIAQVLPGIAKRVAYSVKGARLVLGAPPYDP